MYRIKELRLERGWTQDYLGRLLNVNKSAISKYENNKSDLNAGIIIHFSKIFEVSTDYLLGLSPDKTAVIYTQNASPSSNLPISENENFTQNNSIPYADKKILDYFHRLNEENQDAAKGYMVHLYKDELEAFKRKK